MALVIWQGNKKKGKFITNNVSTRKESKSARSGIKSHELLLSGASKQGVLRRLAIHCI